MKLEFCRTNPPLGGLITAHYLNNSTAGSVDIVWGDETVVENNSQKIPCQTSNDVQRILARTFANEELYGKSPVERTEVDHWLNFSIGLANARNEIPEALKQLDVALGPVTYLTGKRLNIADFAVFAALYANKQWQDLIAKNTTPSNVHRWYSFIQSQEAVVKAIDTMPEEVKVSLVSASTSRLSTSRHAANRPTPEKTEKSSAGGKFVELPGAEMGKVVVRFPPEASGYLHIGHAKAALLNQYYQQAFQGKLILRFDDTNPAKEDKHFEQVILEDVEMLDIKPDMFTHTSQYFDLMMEYCEKLIKDGKAYVDDTDAETMKQQREQKIESENRSSTLEKNMELWNEMKKGTERGQQCCVRAKIDMQSLNGCMRDPTIYRCKNEEHPRTGTKYKVYPTYDFACPIVDAIEGVTHTLRTMEYHDRDPQFYWFIDALGLRKPYIWEYSRLSMMNTVLSKRKLHWFVDQGLVDGWDDPRMPTVRGVLRRGMTVEGLKEFIIAQGSSRSVVFMEWDKIWAFNKKVIDPIAPRFTSVDADEPVTVIVKGAKEECLTVAKHPKNPDVGTKSVWVGPKIIIDRVDAEAIKEGENATFINWGNLMIKKINRENGKITTIEAEPNLDNKDFKKTLKLTFLTETENAPFTPAYCVYFDHLISKNLLGRDEDFKQFINHDTRKEVKMLGDPELKTLKKGDIIQLQRRGFFRVDVAYQPVNLHTCKEQAVILFYIPDGHTKESPVGGGPAANKVSPTSKASGSSKSSIAKQIPQVSTPICPNDEVAKSENRTQHFIKQVEDALKILVSRETKQKAQGSGAGDQVPSQSYVPSATSLNDEIIKQGNLVRDLKAQKAPKPDIDAAVKSLLSLKAEYKNITNTDWKPGCTPPADACSKPANTVPSQSSGETTTELDEEFIKQVQVLLSKLNDDKKSSSVPPASCPKPVRSSDTLKSTEKVANQSADKSATALNEEIIKQGNLVRDLKAQKAPKPDIDAAVKSLLSLKAEYKNVTNTDWKPGCTPPADASSPKPANVVANQSAVKSATALNEEIIKQGNLVRDLKAQKAPKPDIDAAVKSLLSLKAEYKNVTNSDWKPGCTPPADASCPKSANLIANQSAVKSATALNEEIIKQGNLVRDLKAQKAPKPDIDAAVKSLLSLKAEYKNVTNTDWKPGCTPPADACSKPANTAAGKSATELNEEIIKQGNSVRDLKTQKAPKPDIDAAVKLLLSLKAEYKNVTNTEWKPGCTPPADASCTKPAKLSDTRKSVEKDGKQTEKVAKQLCGKSATSLNEEIINQGNIVRDLKAQKASKPVIDAAVKKLLSLKSDFKSVTNTEWKPGCKPVNAPCTEKDDNQTTNERVVKKQTRLGLEAKKDENISDWYSQVITKSQMMNYYNVSGCYILRPWSFFIWKQIKSWFDKEIEKLGVEECYFPMFVSKDVLEKEKEHIADFSPEVAWVTKSGDSVMAEPVAIRPTSETAMYPTYAEWIQSYHDLPIKLNQWNNVVRWEFKHPQPFLRTREFLWQEGHTAYADKQEAMEEVKTILDLYAKIYEELLAVPVVKGRKTEKEKFAGGEYTLTTEAFISASGRAIQGATSHHLGQNFSKMFDLVYEDPKTLEKKHVYQNSWGITTRTIGVMVMIHGDNVGLRLPPAVARYQVVIVPCGITAALSEKEKQDVELSCKALEAELQNADVRAHIDSRSYYSPGWKYNHWEVKGVPIRIELGPKDIQKKQIVAVRRDTGEKIAIPRDNVVEKVKEVLRNIHKNLLSIASEDLARHTVRLTDWAQFTPNLDEKNLILAPFCGDPECEDKIKEDSKRDESAEPGAPSMGAKSLCIPLEQPKEIESTDRCIHPSCSKPPRFYTLFGRSY